MLSSPNTLFVFWSSFYIKSMSSSCYTVFAGIINLFPELQN